METSIASLFAKHFIARPDVKAEQTSTGAYHPVQTRFTKEDINNHLARKVSYGHYLINPETNNCKLFAFDIDFETKGILPVEFDSDGVPGEVTQIGNPRELWRNRSYAGRHFLKQHLMTVAEKIASTVHKQLEVPVAIAYSGYKGVHVYCLTGNISAEKAREGAKLVMDLCNASILHGKNFYSIDCLWDDEIAKNISIEIFPKQDKVESTHFGNLMRLPLGRNFKSNDPTFFIDLTSSAGNMTPVSPSEIVQYIKNGDPWCS